LMREVLGYSEPEQHGERIQSRSKQAIAVAQSLDADWQLRLAAMGMVIFDDEVGVYEMCQRLRLSRDDERSISRMSRDALAAQQSALDAPSLRRWTVAADDRQRSLVLAAAVGDHTEHVAAFSLALDRLLAVEDPTAQTFLDGETIMAELGVSPGPAIGQATAFLHECYFEHGPSAKDQQLEWLQRWWADRVSNS